MKDYVDVPCVVQVQPDLDFNGEVTGGKAMRLTRYPSSNPIPGSVQILLTLRVPKAVFGPLQAPVVNVAVPESMVTIDAVVIDSA